MLKEYILPDSVDCGVATLRDAVKLKEHVDNLVQSQFGVEIPEASMCPPNANTLHDIGHDRSRVHVWWAV